MNSCGIKQAKKSKSFLFLIALLTIFVKSTRGEVMKKDSVETLIQTAYSQIAKSSTGNQAPSAQKLFKENPAITLSNNLAQCRENTKEVMICYQFARYTNIVAQTAVNQKDILNNQNKPSGEFDWTQSKLQLVFSIKGFTSDLELFLYKRESAAKEVADYIQYTFRDYAQFLQQKEDVFAKVKKALEGISGLQTAAGLKFSLGSFTGNPNPCPTGSTHCVANILAWKSATEKTYSSVLMVEVSDKKIVESGKIETEAAPSLVVSRNTIDGVVEVLRMTLVDLGDEAKIVRQVTEAVVGVIDEIIFDVELTSEGFADNELGTHSISCADFGSSGGKAARPRAVFQFWLNEIVGLENKNAIQVTGPQGVVSSTNSVTIMVATSSVKNNIGINKDENLVEVTCAEVDDSAGIKLLKFDIVLPEKEARANLKITVPFESQYVIAKSLYVWEPALLSYLTEKGIEVARMIAPRLRANA